MLSEKEKMEEELKLLEESYILEVITKDEYTGAKKRIEAKLRALEQKEEPKFEVYGAESESKEITAEEKAGKEEAKEDKVKIRQKEETRDIYSDEIIGEEKEEKGYSSYKEESPEEEQLKENDEETEYAEEYPKKPEEEEKEEAVSEIVNKKGLAKVSEEEREPKGILREETESNKKIYVYAVIILILAAISSYLFFFPLSDNPNADADKPLNKPVSFIACSSGKECVKEGLIGTCKNPGKESSECTYIEDAKVELVILNANSCFNCETSRVLSIIKGFFPNLDIKNIDFETKEGKELAEKFSVNALPAYILNSSLKEAHNYNQFSNAFNEADGNFVMKNTVSNANYYISREEIPNRIDLFVKPGQPASLKAEENLKEFLGAFNGKAVFEKHNENEKAAKELGINTFPVFLVNNKVKFSGVQPANKIKENFCEMNKLEECSLELSRNLV